MSKMQAQRYVFDGSDQQMLPLNQAETFDVVMPEVRQNVWLVKILSFNQVMALNVLDFLYDAQLFCSVRLILK